MRSDGKIGDTAWPAERLGDALRELIGRTGLGDGQITTTADFSGQEIEEQIVQAATRAGCEAEPLATTLGDLPNELASAYPALIKLDEFSYLAVMRAQGRNLLVLTPALKRRRIPICDVCNLLREPAAQSRRQDLEKLLSQAGISLRRRKKALSILLNQQLGQTRCQAGWVLRSEAGAAPVRLLRQGGVIGNAAAMIGVHTLQYLLWLASWGCSAAYLSRAAWTGPGLLPGRCYSLHWCPARC
ncbi:MAG: hypothetical protein M3Y72_24250 [Acidobacteriota bacterium]|nr:hypothetical protein [Acidobacteriota bacterium]